MDSQIPPLTLPSGGTVEFVDLDDLTGGDLHDIRRAIREEDSGGETTNKLFIAIMRVAIKTWDVPYLSDPRTPEANPAAYKKLKIRDLRALEAALEPVLDFVKAPKAVPDDEPGSPTRPAGD